MLVWKGIVCGFLESSQSSEEQLTPWNCRCGCRQGRAGVNQVGDGPLGWEAWRSVWGREPGLAQDRSWASLEVLPRGVSQAVPPQITVSPEHFAAPLAAVGLDVCMGEKVSFQITSLIKGSSTCGTFVWRFLFRCEARQRINPSHHHGTLLNSFCLIRIKP